MVKRSYSEGFYRFPRIDYKMLKEHGEGLIVSTACIGGFPAGLIARGEAFKKSHGEIISDLENMSDRFIDCFWSFPPNWQVFLLPFFFVPLLPLAGHG